MNEKLIEILLEKIEFLEKEITAKSIYISALETENVNSQQIIRELEKKEK